MFVVDQPSTTGALPAVARAESVFAAYLPRLTTAQ